VHCSGMSDTDSLTYAEREAAVEDYVWDRCSAEEVSE